MKKQCLLVVQALALTLASGFAVAAHAAGPADRAAPMPQLALKSFPQLASKEPQDPEKSIGPVIQAVADSANYAFSTTTTGSLVDMSTGTTQLLGPNIDDTASPVTLIGFEFYFLGTRQDRFSINENGALRFGTTAVAGALYEAVGQAGQSVITAYGADQRTHAGDGKVHYKVIGSAPNRELVVEWLNTQANFNAGGTADLTYQVHLFETTGNIEFAYGAMTMSVAGAGAADSSTPNIGFSTNNTVGSVGTVAAAQSGAPAPTYNGAATTAASNPYTAGPITVLTSAAQGARRTFLFTTAPINAPGGPLSFTGVSATGVTLNWADSPNESGYAVYQSTDGVNFSFSGTAAMNATSLAVTGLSPATSYTFRVVAFNEGNSASISGTQATTPATPNASLGTGLWSAPGTWSTGVVPGAGDAVTITGGTTVTIDTAAVAFSVAVNGTLQFEQTTARTLAVGTDVTVNGGGTLASNAAGTQTGHVLNVARNLVNNGVLDFSTNADTAGATITFSTATPAIFGGGGSTTDVRTITINKGTSSANLLELNPSTFTVRGVTTDTVVGGWLVMTNGTLRIAGTFSGTSRVFSAAAYTIPATAGLWLDNPNYTIAAQAGNAVNNGVFRLSQGAFNQGTLATHSFRGGTGAVFTIEGGTLNAAGQFSPQNAVTYNQSGGTLNVGLVGNSQSNFGTFELFSASAVFNMTGGTIVLNQASTGATPIDFQNLAQVVAANGTLRVGSATTATNFNFRLRGNVPSFVTDTTTNVKNATATAQVNLFGSPTISSGSTFTINGQICLVLGPLFTNNGTLTGTAAGTRFYFLNNGVATTYTGTGTVTAPLTAFEVDNINGVTLDPAVNPVATLRINNFSGGITHADRLTVGNGGATTAVVQLGVTGVTQPVLGLDVQPVFNPGTGGVINIYAPELTARTTGPELPPARVLTTLTIANTNGLTIDGGDITVNGVGAGALALGSTRVVTGANTLYFNTTLGTITRTTGYVDGNFRKAYAAAASQLFEVGTANGYTPVTVNATAGTFPADVTVAAIQGVAPSIYPPDKALLRYWTVDAPGLTADVTWSYLDPEDIQPTVTESALTTYRFDGTTYIDIGGTLDIAANTMAQAGLTTFGRFTLAEPGATTAGNADLSITKDDGVASVLAGGTLTYTVTASNAGPLPANGAVVTDTLPAALTCTWTCAGAGGGTCTAAGAGNIADTVQLPVGASATYTLSCGVSPGAGTSIANTASIAPPVSIIDPDASNDSATDTDSVSHDADLSITNTDGVTTVDTGANLQYTITAVNQGPVDANGVGVSDAFPADLTCTWTCSASGGGTCAPAGSGAIADTIDLPAGSSAVYAASCSVASASASTSIVNTATLTPPPLVTDPTPGDHVATDTDTLVRLVDLSVTKTDGVTVIAPGGAVAYEIFANNAGPNTVSATVTDTLPATLNSCTWTCTAVNGTCTASGSGSIADAVTINSGGSLHYTAECTVSPSASGTLSNTATVAVASAAFRDTNAANDSATDTDTLVAQLDLAITVDDGRTFVQVGETVDYTIVVSNASGPSIANATVSDVLPAELDLGSWACVGTNGATCASGTGNVLSDTAVLPPGSTVTYVYTATVAGDLGGTIANTATVSASGDTNPANDSATDTPADTIVVFKDGFDGGPLTKSVAVNAGTTASGHVQLDAALVRSLGARPIDVARGESAHGVALFTLQAASLDRGEVVRVLTRDAHGLWKASAWMPFDAVGGQVSLNWQSSTAAARDGHLEIASAGQHLRIDGLGAREALARIVHGEHEQRAWMRWLDGVE